MARKLIVAVPEYWQYALKPQNFEDFCDRFATEDHGPLGIWCLRTIDKATGEVLEEQWRKNLLLDTGGLAYLTRTFGTSTPSNMFGQLAITNAVASTTLATAIVQGAASPLTVEALPAAIPADYSTTGAPAGTPTQLIIGYGTNFTQYCQVTSAHSAGATSLAIQGIGGSAFAANNAYPVGTNIVPQPFYNENPTSLNVNQGGNTLIAYSGAYSNATFATSGSGPGRRQITITYTFSTTGSPAAPAGNYTEAWVINTAASTPVSAAGQCAVHITFMPMAVNAYANGQVVVVEKV